MDFPLDALPPPLADLARVAASVGGYPPAFIAIPGLSVMAAAVGGRAVLGINRTFRARAIIWTDVSAPPGAAKGPGLRVAARPLVKMEAIWSAQYREALEQYAANLADYKAELAAFKLLTASDKRTTKEPEEPELPPLQRRCLVGDATIEVLGPILLENPASGILWIREELKSIIGSLDQYHAGGKGSGRSSLIELHDGQLLQVDRKGDRNSGKPPLFVPEPRVSVTGGTVPEGFGSILGDADGLGPRFLSGHLPGTGLSLVNIDRDVPQAAIDRWDALVRAMITVPDTGVALPALQSDEVATVRLGPDARRVWKATTPGFTKVFGRGGTSAFGQQVIGKASVHLASMALVLHVANDPEHIPAEITGETLERAAALISYFIDSALELDLLEPSAAANRQTQQIDDAIDRRLIPWLRRRPGQMATQGDLTAARIVGRTAGETAAVATRYGETHPGCVLVGERRGGVTHGPVPTFIFAPTSARTPATSATSDSHTSPDEVPEGDLRSNREFNPTSNPTFGDKPLSGVAEVAGVPPAPDRDGHASPQVPLPADQGPPAAVPEWEL